MGSDLRQAIWTAFEQNGIGIPFPQRQVYPMEWPPAQERTLGTGAASHPLQGEESSADPNKPPDSGGETP